LNRNRLLKHIIEGKIEGQIDIAERCGTLTVWTTATTQKSQTNIFKTLNIINIT